MAETVEPQVTDGTPVSRASVEIQSADDLGHLFRSMAEDLFGVQQMETAFMRTVPIPAAGQMRMDSEPMPDAWYSRELAGSGDKWALVDPASLLQHGWEFTPYAGCTLTGTWAQVYPQGAPWVWGWQVTATFAMDPDVTLLRAIDAYRRIIVSMAVSGRRSLRFLSAPGVLHMASISSHMAPHQHR